LQREHGAQFLAACKIATLDLIEGKITIQKTSDLCEIAQLKAAILSELRNHLVQVLQLVDSCSFMCHFQIHMDPRIPMADEFQSFKWVDDSSIADEYDARMKDAFCCPEKIKS